MGSFVRQVKKKGGGSASEVSSLLSVFVELFIRDVWMDSLLFDTQSQGARPGPWRGVLLWLLRPLLLHSSCAVALHDLRFHRCVESCVEGICVLEYLGKFNLME